MCIPRPSTLGSSWPTCLKSWSKRSCTATCCLLGSAARRGRRPVRFARILASDPGHSPPSPGPPARLPLLPRRGFLDKQLLSPHDQRGDLAVEFVDGDRLTDR